MDGEIWLKGERFCGILAARRCDARGIPGRLVPDGDLAVRSEDGYYTLCGRKSDLIISGGFNIYPREIEEFLMEQQQVAEAAVAAAWTTCGASAGSVRRAAAGGRAGGAGRTPPRRAASFRYRGGL